jgi:putative transposase
LLQNHCRDLRPGYDHLLRNLKAAQAVIASQSATFRRCYGSSYIAGDLAEYLEDKGMKHVRGAPMHPQTQGKIERWHQTLKNRILLENYFFEGELEAAIAAFIEHYNNRRYHESIGNLTPADVYFGRGETILAERRRIKLQTIQNRRLNHQRQAA